MSCGKPSRILGHPTPSCWEEFPLDTHGVCFGFTVRSDLRFAYLRDGGGEMVLEVGPSDRPDPGPDGTPVQEWLPREEHPFHARLFQEPDGWRFWVDGIGSYWIDPRAPAVQIPSGAPPIQTEERLWGIPSVLCFLERGDHSLHASTVQIGDRAIAFGAPGRFGKTTIASALVAAGHRLLSEDSTCLRIAEGGTSVVPGPAMLRIRKDTYEHLTLPKTTRVAEDDDRVHLALDESTRGTGAPVPLAGVMLLRQGADDTDVRIEPATQETAIQDLWALSFKLPTEISRAACFDNVGRLVTSVPIWDLTRPMRYDTLDDVVKAIAEVAG